MTIIDESYVALKRLDPICGDQIRKVVFMAQEIESSQFFVIKIFLPNE
jgi:hypothetical protein